MVNTNLFAALSGVRPGCYLVRRLAIQSILRMNKTLSVGVFSWRAYTIKLPNRIREANPARVSRGVVVV